jgi:hypothetical protein
MIITLGEISFDPPPDESEILIPELTLETAGKLGWLVGPEMASRVMALVNDLNEQPGVKASCSISLEPGGTLHEPTE